MDSLLKTLDPYRWALMAALATAALAATYGYGWVQYDKGYAKAQAASVEVVAKERIAEFNRQASANATAQAEAALTIDRLTTERNDLEARLKENALAASQDPHARRPALGADSMRRLNQVR